MGRQYVSETNEGDRIQGNNPNLLNKEGSVAVNPDL